MNWTSPLLIVSLAGWSTLNASDWPQYRGPKSDGSTADRIATSWPAAGPAVVWKVPSTGGFSSFVIAKGHLFTQELREIDSAQQETVVARNADSGKEIWQQALGTMKINDGGQSGTKGNDGGDGPRSTPSIDGNHVLTLSAKLVLTCFDAATGKTVWRHDLIKEYSGRNISWMNAASPVVEGKLVLVGGGGPGESILAFNKDTGDVAWKAFDEKITHATPVVANILGTRQVVFFLQSGLLSVDPKTGAELWRHAFPYKVSTAASPVVAGDIVYCSAGYDVGAGAARISHTGGKWTAEPVYRFPGNKPLANHWSTPVLNNGYLYGMFQFKEYGSGPVKCVDVKTGAVKWEQPGFGPGQVILVGDQVLALSDAGELVLFKADPSGYHETARATVLAGKCWTTPVVSNGRVYARSAREAVCLDLNPKRASR